MKRKLSRGVTIVGAGMSKFGMTLKVKYLHHQEGEKRETYLAFEPA